LRTKFNRRRYPPAVGLTCDVSVTFTGSYEWFERALAEYDKVKPR
jgi:hypothetical protein